MAQKFETTVLDMIEQASRTSKTTPLNLGGIAGAGGGVGTPPGGYIGWLPQTRVAYDYDELASSGIPASGMSILDNLNHIRYRLDTLENASGILGSGIIVVDENTSNTYSNIDTVHFVGSGVLVTDLGSGDVLVTISGGGISDAPADNNTYGRKNNEWVAVSGIVASGSYSLVVEKIDGSPIITDVDRIIFSGASVTDLGNGDALVAISDIDAYTKTESDLLYIPTDSWIAKTDTWTRTGNHTFTISGDVTAIYRKGTKIRYKDGGAYEYGVIYTSSYSNPNTTITLVTNDTYAMAAATITDTYISYIENPEGFPAEFDYTPTTSGLSVGDGTLTYKWKAMNNILFCYIYFDLGSSSSISSDVQFSLPVTVSYVGNLTGTMGNGSVAYAAMPDATATTLYYRVLLTSGTYGGGSLLSATVPFTWNSSCILFLRFWAVF